MKYSGRFIGCRCFCSSAMLALSSSMVRSTSPFIGPPFGKTLSAFSSVRKNWDAFSEYSARPWASVPI